ncbi:MAG: hypothetical protein VKJ06_00570 [Vampirovibrionales bacterium]|nr:hypothetical protein [Vampirovibrionales bacterium]
MSVNFRNMQAIKIQPGATQEPQAPEVSQECPYCKHRLYLPEVSLSRDIELSEHAVSPIEQSGTRPSHIEMTVVQCTNPECIRFSLSVTLFGQKKNKVRIAGQATEPVHCVIKQWNLLPEGTGKAYPIFIPAEIRQLYQEAVGTLNASPRASAALSRQCIQRIVRSVFNIQKLTLRQELIAIRDKVDPIIYKVIQNMMTLPTGQQTPTLPGAGVAASRELAASSTSLTIGCNMEGEAGLIKESTDLEARKLILLAQFMLDELYVERYQKESMLKKVVSHEESRVRLKSELLDLLKQEG